MHVERFEPVFLQVEGPLLPTEHGKRWIDSKNKIIEKFGDVFKDIARVARIESSDWDPKLNALQDAGLVMMASGIGQATMQKVLDYLDGLTTTAFSPAGTFLGLAPSAPTSTSTGVTFGDGTSNYTGYGRFTATPATYFNAATAATPAVVTTKAQIQFAACSGGGSVTENGIMLCDLTGVNTGVNYFFGSITAVVISPTQTPPTIASGALSISMNTT